MPPKGFICKRCGHCCREMSDAYQTSIDAYDYRRWEREGRIDILEWVNIIYRRHIPFVYDIWIHPTEHDYVERCPWLRKVRNKNEYTCRIQDMKPAVCRNFPKSVSHAVENGCQGFNHLPQEEIEGMLKEEMRHGDQAKEILSLPDPFGFDALGEYKNMVYLQGYLVPLAQIKGISEIDFGLSSTDDGEGHEADEYGFTVSLNGVTNDDNVFDNSILLGFVTELEAALAFSELTRRIDAYYDRLAGRVRACSE